MNVKWGGLQSVLQVMVGLNLAYYSFREMRTPHLRTIREDIDELQRDIYQTIHSLSNERSWAHKSGTQSRVPDSYERTSELLT